MIAFRCPSCGAYDDLPEYAPAITCRACGYVATLRQAPQKPTWPRFPRWAWVVIVLVVLYAIGKSRPTEPAAPKQDAGVKAQTTEVVLTAENGGLIVVGVTEADLDEAYKFDRADDRKGLMDLYLAGRTYRVPSGTKVKVIERPWFKARVRILDGKHIGRDGWVSSDFLNAE